MGFLTHTFINEHIQYRHVNLEQRKAYTAEHPSAHLKSHGVQGILHKYREIKFQPAVQPGQHKAPCNSMQEFTQLLGKALQPGLSSALP